MRHILALLLVLIGVAACDSHDPILPGVRTAIFDTAAPKVLNITIDNLPPTAVRMPDSECPYTRDASNTIWDGDRKIFTGFPTSNTVQTTHTPVCSGGYVYAGLTTGELVRVNPKTRAISWIADIYRPSNMTGGASVVDIVAPIVINDGAVYVGGLGDAYCRVNMRGGDKKWCVEIGVGTPFVVTDVASFVMATDGNLYAIRNRDGAIYWRTHVDAPATPTYENGIITIGKQRFNATDGTAAE